MNCRKAEGQMVELVSGVIRTDAERVLRRHLSNCDTCPGRLSELSKAWNLIGRWEDEVPPASVKDRVQRRILDEMRAETSAVPLAGFQVGREVLLPVSLGILAAVVSMFGILWQPGHSSTPVSVLAATGAVWAGLYVGVFLAIFRRLYVAGLDVGRLCRLGLAGALGAIVFFSVCPITSEAHVCEMIPFLEPLFAIAGGTPAYFILGAFSALVPMFLLAAIVGKRFDETPRAAAILVAAIVVLLLSPALVLQKAPFSVEIMLLALGGTLFGSFAGSFAGTLLGLWTASRTAISHAG